MSGGPTRVHAPPFGSGARAALYRALTRGEPLAFPTETFYALGGNALLPGLCARVFALKRRLAEKALLVLVDGERGLGDLATEVPPAAEALMAACWPGPLTLVLPAGPGTPPHLRDARGTVALRWSPHPVVAELLRLGGVPLIGTSANPSGGAPARTLSEVLAGFPALPHAVDGGATPGGEPSTVLDASALPFRLVRPGAVSLETIREGLAGRFPEAVPP